MKVKCLYNTGKALLKYERPPLGTSETQYGQLEIGKEYLVMGMLLGEGILDYLIDSGGVISACPYPLFEIVDNKLNSNWFFRSFAQEDTIYPYQVAVWGYYELVFDTSHFEKLVEVDEEAQRIYFRRKIEIEREL
jgi:hypothetical protein